jgi:ABC-type glycerol-3-phosphate transport system substrate-binding protein
LNAIPTFWRIGAFFYNATLLQRFQQIFGKYLHPDANATKSYALKSAIARKVKKKLGQICLENN